MKISKLFHWLYATLMFLPLMFFLPSCFYYGFNEHATNTEITTITYKYQSNEVNSVNDLVEGNIYSLSCQGLGLSDLLTEDESLDFLLLSNLSLDTVSSSEAFDINLISSINYLRFYVVDESEMHIIVFNNSDFEFNDRVIDYEFFDTFLNDCIIQLLGGYYFNSSSLIQYLSYTDYNEIESVEVNTDNTIPQQISRAWNSVWNLPIFSWTHNTFVAAPFTYITGLFGLSSDNSLNYAFAYFVSISICWLVFDLIMYVPNLAHRWLDRSALE